MVLEENDMSRLEPLVVQLHAEVQRRKLSDGDRGYGILFNSLLNEVERLG